MIITTIETYFFVFSLTCFILQVICKNEIIGIVHSLCHALLSVFIALYTIYFDFGGQILLHITTIYYIYELIISRNKHGYALLFHHIISLFAILYFMSVESVSKIVPYIMFIYVSNIFLNIKYLLSKEKLNSSSWYIVNGVLLWISYVICRLLLIPFVIYQTSKITNDLDFVIITLTLGSIWVLSLYWFFLITKKIIQHSKKKEK